MFTAIEIRIAGANDLDGINCIRCYVTEDPSSPHNLTPLTTSLIERTQGQITFIAETHTRIVAYLSLRNSSSFDDPVSADIEVFVLPEEQGRGRGKALLTRVEAYAIGETRLSRLTLGVMLANPRARGLYERRGFHSLGKDSIGENMAKDIVRANRSPAGVSRPVSGAA